MRTCLAVLWSDEDYHARVEEHVIWTPRPPICGCTACGSFICCILSADLVPLLQAYVDGTAIATTGPPSAVNGFCWALHLARCSQLATSRSPCSVLGSQRMHLLFPVKVRVLPASKQEAPSSYALHRVSLGGSFVPLQPATHLSFHSLTHRPVPASLPASLPQPVLLSANRRQGEALVWRQSCGGQDEENV